jgi:hypothetical protein
MVMHIHPYSCASSTQRKINNAYIKYTLHLHVETQMVVKAQLEFRKNNHMMFVHFVQLKSWVNHSTWCVYAKQTMWQTHSNTTHTLCNIFFTEPKESFTEQYFKV